MALRANAVAFGVFSVDFSLLHRLQKQGLRMSPNLHTVAKNLYTVSEKFLYG